MYNTKGGGFLCVDIAVKQEVILFCPTLDSCWQVSDWIKTINACSAHLHKGFATCRWWFAKRKSCVYVEQEQEVTDVCETQMRKDPSGPGIGKKGRMFA